MELGLSIDDVSDGRARLIRQIRQQNAVEPSRLRINPHNRLSTNILCGIRDQAVLSQCDNKVFFLKLERWDEGAVDQLLYHSEIEGAAERIQRGSIGVIFAFVICKATTGMLDVELRLRPRVEALHQLLQLGSLRYDHELLVHDHFPVLPINDFKKIRRYIEFSDLLRIFRHLLKCKGNYRFGVVFFPPSIINFFQSRSRKGLRVSVRV